jgi:hypothetical protein
MRSEAAAFLARYRSKLPDDSRDVLQRLIDLPLIGGEWETEFAGPRGPGGPEDEDEGRRQEQDLRPPTNASTGGEAVTPGTRGGVVASDVSTFSRGLACKHCGRALPDRGPTGRLTRALYCSDACRCQSRRRHQ